MSADQRDAPPTVVTFEVQTDQVWIDRDDVSWYVTSVGTRSVILERTVVETVPIRDLVRGYREMNETHPLIPSALDEKGVS